MFTVIDKKDLSRLTNLEVAGYAQESGLATELLAAVSELGTNVQYFKNAYVDYQKCLALYDTKKITEQIHQVTDHAELVWGQIYNLASGQTSVFGEEVTDAAESVLSKMDHYGPLSNLTYDAKYGIIANLLVDITVEEADKIGITPLMSALDSDDVQYVELSGQRKDLRKARKQAVRKSRAALELAYRMLVRAVENYALINGVTAVEPFVNRINELVIERVEKTKSNAKTATVSEETGDESSTQAELATEQDSTATEVGEGLDA